LGRLEVYERGQEWYEDMGHAQWLELLHPSDSVQHLAFSEELVEVVAPALQEIASWGRRVPGVLPALENLFIEGSPSSGPIQEAFDEFVTVRWFFNYSVAVYPLERALGVRL
jgi:hypothetical protein